MRVMIVKNVRSMMMRSMNRWIVMIFVMGLVVLRLLRVFLSIRGDIFVLIIIVMMRLILRRLMV